MWGVGGGSLCMPATDCLGDMRLTLLAVFPRDAGRTLADVSRREPILSGFCASSAVHAWIRVASIWSKIKCV